MWKNLAPDLVRQRLIIEGTTKDIVDGEKIKEYLLKLSEISKMSVIAGPVAYSGGDAGFGGWIQWKESGAHFYSYHENPPLFTLDTYSCKRFSVEEVLDFTKTSLNPIEIVWKEV